MDIYLYADPRTQLQIVWDAAAVCLNWWAVTLHRWFELECGDSNDYQSWCLVRGSKNNGVFTHDDDGKPHMERHYHPRGVGKTEVRFELMADRETGARKRLDRIMAKYPQLRAWIQTDPRGGTIYLCKPEDATDSLYTRGVFIA